MADHVPGAEPDEGQPVDPGQHRLQALQAAPPVGNVDLAYVAGDHDPGSKADPGEEHLHLLGRGVLRLVEDDEAVVEGAPPHEGQGCHLHHSPVEESLGGLGLDHVEEGVVERSEVRVYLGHEVAGQESHPFSGFDQGPGQDDAVHLAGLECTDGHGDGEPTLAGACRSDGEGDDPVGHRLDVALLPDRPGTDRPSPSGSQNLGGQHLGWPLVGLHHVDRPVQGPLIDVQPALEQGDYLVEHPSDGGGMLPVNGDPVAPDMDLRSGKRPLDTSEQHVALADEVRHEVVAGNCEGDGGRLHVLETG